MWHGPNRSDRNGLVNTCSCRGLAYEFLSLTYWPLGRELYGTDLANAPNCQTWGWFHRVLSFDLCSLGEIGKHDRLKICSFWVIGSSPIVSILLARKLSFSSNEWIDKVDLYSFRVLTDRQGRSPREYVKLPICTADLRPRPVFPDKKRKFLCQQNLY